MDRHTTSKVTLGALGVLTVVMLIVGFSWATSPLPETDSSGGAQVCETRVVASGTRIRAADLTVSVYNATRRSGLASQTMAELMDRGFGQGRSGNMSDVEIEVAEVWADSADDPAAKLVASHLGPGVRINTDHPRSVPGIVVVLGTDFRRLGDGEEFTVAEEDTTICSPSLDWTDTDDPVDPVDPDLD